MQKLKRIRYLILSLIAILAAAFACSKKYEEWRNERQQREYQQCNINLQLLNDRIKVLEDEYEKKLSEDKISKDSLEYCIKLNNNCKQDLDNCLDTVEEFRIDGCFEAHKLDYLSITFQELSREFNMHQTIELCHDVITTKEKHISMLNESLTTLRKNNTQDSLDHCKEEYEECRLERRECGMEIRNICRDKRYSDWYLDQDEKL